MEEEKVPDTSNFDHIKPSQIEDNSLAGMSSGGRATPLDGSANEVQPIAEVENSGATEIGTGELSLDILMKIDLKNQEHVDYVIKEMKQHRLQKKPYKSFFPIKRLKGTVKKVHRLGVSTYSRFLYLNPIEGVLISYQNQSKFPHSSSYIIKLNEIKECCVLFEEKQSKWFFKKG